MAPIKISDTLVLIPAYNEEKNIGRVASAVKAMGFTPLVIDDGSKDRTSELASKAGAEVLTLPQNQGKGMALRRGFDWFLSKSFSALILMDSDGQHDPAELISFTETLNNGAQFVVGNRMQCAKGMPWLRLATNHFLSSIISLAARQNIPDSQCGYRAITREALQKMSLRTMRYEIESEMLLEASRNGYRIVSIPIRCVYEGGKSQIHPWRDTLRFLKFITQYSFRKK